MNTFELNNVRKDDIINSQLKKTSPVVEVFSALVNGESLEKFGKTGDKAVAYIKSLGEKAMNGDTNAISELNTIRRFVIEAPVMEELKLLNVFGSYTNIGFDESIEREITKYDGEYSRPQANNGDVVFPVVTTETYPVASFTISGGYTVDYRRVALGDMSKENEGIRRVKTDILNRATLAVVQKVYEAIKNATGVKYFFEGSGLTKTGVDGVLTKVRRIGRPTVIADYALLSQFTPWAGYVGTIDTNTITGISEKVLDEIAQNGTIARYNGATLVELANPYNYNVLNKAGDNFTTLMPAGIGLVIPAGANSPIATWTRGGLTSCSGVDVKTGRNVSRYDLEVAVDVAKGREYEVGVISDTAVSGLA